MKTVEKTIALTVYCALAPKESWLGTMPADEFPGWDYCFNVHGFSASEEAVKIGSQEIAYVIPAGINILEGAVANLDAAMSQETERHQRIVDELERKKFELLALEYKPEESVPTEDSLDLDDDIPF